MKKFWIPYFKTRTLSFYGGACLTYLTTKQVVNNDNSSLNISGFKYSGFNIGTRYYLNENLFVSGYLCMGSPSEIEYVSNDNSTKSYSAKILSGKTNTTSFSFNYIGNFSSFSTYAGVGISSFSSKLEYSDSISKLNHKIDINQILPNIILGVEYIGFYNSYNYIINVDLNMFLGTTLEITNSNTTYETKGAGIWSLTIGHSF